VSRACERAASIFLPLIAAAIACVQVNGRPPETGAGGGAGGTSS